MPPGGADFPSPSPAPRGRAVLVARGLSEGSPPAFGALPGSPTPWALSPGPRVAEAVMLCLCRCPARRFGMGHFFCPGVAGAGCRAHPWPCHKRHCTDTHGCTQGHTPRGKAGNAFGELFSAAPLAVGQDLGLFSGSVSAVFFSPGPIQAKSPAPFTQGHLFASPATSRGRSNPPALRDCSRPQHHL